ncbi:TPA: hypothetical protein ACRND3_005149 [Pseudomonas aeruginosa]|uniref:hypothetical protein n=1 Tax=Pseudomonas aeruginosa TaxID=287 RepID=UPI0010ABB5B7|nr:hypothetical protein [Pseudomonas aeruginosa]TJY45298.1 hypothetical protein FCG96_29230 [Pseudomonas aeruginosa]HBO0992600.1 hypothetical protein [Pseudomonas aeruginosa]HBO1242645.1 hypothetical protein [Pseudomonas aeruginosa]HBO1352199.1 hypothetical protein [Pseudomonas aeruginosa]HBO1496252.1 hypothetical protein [Pseudomonas aeruginosa]
MKLTLSQHLAIDFNIEPHRFRTRPSWSATAPNSSIRSSRYQVEARDAGQKIAVPAAARTWLDRRGKG